MIFAMTSMRNFHLPLPPALHEALRATAEAAGVPATKMALDLLRRGLDDYRRERRRTEIASYAAALAGTTADLDAGLERAGIDALDQIS